MIPELGHFALILALLVAIAQGALPLAGAAYGEPRLMALSKPAARAVNPNWEQGGKSVRYGTIRPTSTGTGVWCYDFYRRWQIVENHPGKLLNRCLPGIAVTPSDANGACGHRRDERTNLHQSVLDRSHSRQCRQCRQECATHTRCYHLAQRLEAGCLEFVALSRCSGAADGERLITHAMPLL